MESEPVYQDWEEERLSVRGLEGRIDGRGGRVKVAFTAGMLVYRFSEVLGGSLIDLTGWKASYRPQGLC